MTVDIDKWVLECQECQKEGDRTLGASRNGLDWKVKNNYRWKSVYMYNDRLFYKMVYCIPVKNQICIQSCAVHN